MRNVLNGLIIFSLVFNTSCGQQDGKVAEGAVDSDTVIVNRIRTVQDSKGNEGTYGEIGIVHGANSVDELNAAVDNDEIMYLTEDEVRNSEALRLVQVDADEAEEAIAPLAAGFIGLFLGLAIGSAPYRHHYHGHYHRHAVAYRTSYVAPVAVAAPVVAAPVVAAPVAVAVPTTTVVTRRYVTVPHATVHHRYWW